MAIQKKSLISKLNTTKKAIVASSTPAQENPSVSAPVTARFGSAKVRKELPKVRMSALNRKKW